MCQTPQTTEPAGALRLPAPSAMFKMMNPLMKLMLQIEIQVKKTR